MSFNGPIAHRACLSRSLVRQEHNFFEKKNKNTHLIWSPGICFRLVYDRETGKPKGYGFCEYQDIETAQSALRNLNNTDFNGRPLRVGVAAGESNKDDMAGMQQALGGPVLEVSKAIVRRSIQNS